MESYWLPDVNRLGTYGRWAFLELQDSFTMEKELGEWIVARAKE
jgi:type III restriction enzyme